MKDSKKVSLSALLLYVIGFALGAGICYTSAINPNSKMYKQAYKQGQIDCIEGRVIYQPDTTTNYVKIEP